MGAAPDWKDQRCAASPLREFESQTVSVISHTGKPGPRRFARVPTHAIGVAEERRRNPRAALSLPLRLIRVGDRPEPIPVTLVTRNISSSGIYFLAPRHFAPGTAIELEVALIERPLGQGSVQMCTAVH
ncbi:MAG: PilZ domain-containing protein, partial [Candidatus Acidiferrales bacterium]